MNKEEINLIEETEKIINFENSQFKKYFFSKVILKPKPGLKNPWQFKMMVDSLEVLKKKINLEEKKEKTQNEITKMSDYFEKLSHKNIPLDQRKEVLSQMFEKFKEGKKNWPTKTREKFKNLK